MSLAILIQLVATIGYLSLSLGNICLEGGLLPMKYMNPEMEVIKVSLEDVITTSTVDNCPYETEEEPF